ncbi:hypothetical protein Tco_0608897 [Tanacetum coccineum]
MVESSKVIEKDYRKLLVTDEMVEKCDKGNEKEAEHDQLTMNKEKLEVDFARAIKAEQAKHDKGKRKVYDFDDLKLDDLDLENKIKKLEVDFGRMIKAKKAKEAKQVEHAQL